MGDVVQFRDWQQPKDLARMYGEGQEIIKVALIGPGGIDDLVYETSLGFVDTTPSEYVAPSDDSA